MEIVIKVLRDHAERGFGLSPAMVRSLAQETYKNREPELKPIDRVTTDLLSKATRVVGIYTHEGILDRIIDLVELIEHKGDSTTLYDLSKLEKEWNSEGKKG